MRSLAPVTWLLLALTLPTARADLSAPALLPGDLAPAATAGLQQKADIARGGDRYLLVWEDTRQMLTGTVSNAGQPAGQTDVYAMRLDAGGLPLDAAPILVSQETFSQSDPRVAWNGTDWLVVWTTRRPTASTTTRGIHGARVSGDGFRLDATPIVIDDDDDWDEQFPSVASDGSSWAVVYQDTQNQLTGAYAAKVAADGTVVAHKTIGTSALGPYIPRDARIGFAGGRYLVTAQHYTVGGASGQFDDLYGRFFDAALDPIAPEFPIDAGPASQNKSWIASNGSQFYVVWNMSGNVVEGTPVLADGTVLVPGGVTLFAAPDMADPRAAWDGTRWITSVDHQTGIHEVYADSQGQVIQGSPFVLEPHAFGAPAIQDSVVAAGAGVPGRAVVVWTDSRTEATDLLARTIEPGGAIGDLRTVSVSAPAQHHPDLAGDLARGYLVVFVAESAGVRRIAAQRVDGTGQALDLEPAILHAGGLETGFPRVAWNGGEWLVVWAQRASAGTPIGARTYGVRIGSDGTRLDATPIDVVAGETPDVAALGGEFLVATSDEPTNHVRYVRSMRVRASDGALLDASSPLVAPSYATAPRVEALGTRWLVVWERRTTHDSPFTSIRGAFVDASGAPQPFFLAGVGPFALDTGPALSVLGGVAELVWSYSDDVRARRIQADGTLLDTDAGVVISGAANDQFAPAVGSDGTSWPASWNDYRNGDLLDAPLGDLYSTAISAAGTALDPGGAELAAEPAVPEGNPAVAGDLGYTLFAYAVMTNEAPYAGYRIAIRGGVTTTVGGEYCFGDGSAIDCPCGNASPPGVPSGCLNSSGQGARLGAAGTASLSSDTLILAGTGMPPGNALYLQGTQSITGVVLGDGARCVGGSLVRLGAKSNVGGSSHYPAAGDLPVSVRGAVLAPGTRTYQIWYRDTASFCSADPFNLSSALVVTWTP